MLENSNESGTEGVPNRANQQMDVSAQLGEADTWKDQLMTLVRQNKVLSIKSS